MSKAVHNTFKGGVHPPYHKEMASGSEISAAPVPQELTLLLQQHVGAPDNALVSPGDRVKVGQKIGESEAFISAPVHSPVAGTVRSIEDVRNFAGQMVQGVVITSDSEQPAFAGQGRGSLEALTQKDIRDIAREAGLVGLGGAAFPTHVKLTPPEDNPVDIVIINGCECEPFLTCDHRLMLERSGDIMGGLKLMMKATGAERGIVGIEANKMDAVEQMRAAVADLQNVTVEILDVKYPEGAEKQLIVALTGRAVPPGKLPSEVGCLVQNVGTAVALFEAASTGKPLYERVVTVSGPGIREPGNLLVKVGTPISTLIEACGGLTGESVKLIVGGPMTGWAQESTDTVVVKGTSGLVALTSEMVDIGEELECVRCGKCVDACPMYLMPNFIVEATKDGEWEKAEMWGALDCFECGVCSYTCPAYIPHVQYVRTAKAEIAALKRR